VNQAPPHDLVGLGEVMLRLAARPPQRLDQATELDVQIGGTEANVAAACARLGLRTAVISVLPAEHAWGDRTVRELTGHGVDCRGVLRPPGPEDVDWSLVRQARLAHLTGVTAALGANLRAVVRRAVDEAAAARVPVSFDVNYRSRLWSPKEARDFLTEVLPRVSYLFIGADDAATVFELAGEPERVLEGMRRLAPAATIALTLGEAGSAVLTPAGVRRPSRRHAVTVVDRVGAGDAFAAGFLWATLIGRDAQQAVDAATALAALKCTIWGDVSLVSRPELEELLATDSTEIRR